MHASDWGVSLRRVLEVGDNGKTVLISSTSFEIASPFIADYQPVALRLGSLPLAELCSITVWTVEKRSVFRLAHFLDVPPGLARHTSLPGVLKECESAEAVIDHPHID